MPFAEHHMVQGTFTAPSSLPGAVNVNCGFLPSRVQLINMSALGSMTGGPPVANPGANYLLYRALWNSAFASAATPFTLVEAITPSALTSSLGIVTSNGISLYDGSQAPSLGAAVTAGALSKANPAQITSTAHGLQTGDQILVTAPFTATTAMNQLGGIVFSVTVTGANTFTIPINTNTANFTATTVTTYRKVNVGNLFYPQKATITGITAANPMVITTSTNHGLTVGQQVRLRVPSQFAMTQANNLQGVITAVTATTITLGGINSAAFTAFAWPAVTSVPFTHAQVIPIGAAPSAVTLGNVTYYNDVLDDAVLNNQFQGFSVGTNILATASSTVLGITASDVFQWTAWRADA